MRIKKLRAGIFAERPGADRDGNLFADKENRTIWQFVNGVWGSIVRFFSSASAPVSPIEGDIYLSSVDNKPRIFANGQWQVFAIGNDYIKNGLAIQEADYAVRSGVIAGRLEYNSTPLLIQQSRIDRALAPALKVEQLTTMDLGWNIESISNITDQYFYYSRGIYSKVGKTVDNIDFANPRDCKAFMADVVSRSGGADSFYGYYADFTNDGPSCYALYANKGRVNIQALKCADGKIAPLYIDDAGNIFKGSEISHLSPI